MSARKIPGKGWFVDFQLNGQRIRKRSPVQSRRGAEEFEHQIREAWLSGPESEPPERKEVTLKEFRPEFMENYVKVRNKPSEQDEKESIFRLHLLPVFGEFQLEAIRSRDIDQYISSKLAKGYKPATVNAHLACLSKTLRQAAEWGLMDHPPTIHKLPVGNQPYDFFTFDEKERLLESLWKEPRWAAPILFGLDAGLRVGEVCALHKDDVDLVAGKVVVQRTMYKGVEVPTKSNKPREIPLTERLVSAVKAHKTFDATYLFVDEAGELLSRHNLGAPLRRACRRAGFRQVRFHVLRHTFASHLVMLGVPIKAVQELLGHADLRMTLRYAHLTPDVRKEAVTRLETPRKETDSPNFGQLLGNKSENRSNPIFLSCSD